MNRQTIRIRFKKERDLRLISHRDLARAFERLFRRIELPLAMSQGFHPHPKISFPLALAVGVEGRNEVVDVVVDQEVAIADVEERLKEHTPDGLVITKVEAVAAKPKSKVNRVCYQLSIPTERIDSLVQTIDEFLKSSRHEVERSSNKRIDIRPGVESIDLNGSTFEMELSVSQDYNVRPREVLQALKIDDLEFEGHRLIRTNVYLDTEQSEVA